MSQHERKSETLHNGYEIYIKAGLGNHLKSGLTGLMCIVVASCLTLFFDILITLSCLLITQINLVMKMTQRSLLSHCFIVLCLQTAIQSISLVSQFGHVKSSIVFSSRAQNCASNVVLKTATILFVPNVSRLWGEGFDCQAILVRPCFIPLEAKGIVVSIIKSTIIVLCDAIIFNELLYLKSIIKSELILYHSASWICSSLLR